jgi:exonuclease VII small subunit
MTEKRAAGQKVGTDSDEIPVSELSYTDASRELDEIVEFFEHRDVDVDQLVARLERATSIVDELDRRVRRTRSQVEQLVPRLQASARGDEPQEEDPDEDELEESVADARTGSVESELFG